MAQGGGEHKKRDGAEAPGAPFTQGSSPTAIGPGAAGTAWDPTIVFRPGQIVAGRFVIRQAIGRGGMGAVYAAEDSLTKAPVALKAILPSLLSSARVRDRFIEEVNIARSLHHPRIVTVFDLVAYEGAFGGAPGGGGGILYTMELLQGHTLRAFMRHHGRLSLEVCARILDGICEALEYAHQFTIHRDVSPENIMLLQDRTVKLLDFGIAKPLETDTHLETHGAMGKDYYMAPEQRRNAGAVDPRADIWALGVTLFEMLTAEMPMGYDSVRALRPDLPKSCEQLIQWALAPVDERCASAREFREGLKACLSGAEMPIARKGGAHIGRLTRRQMLWIGLASLPVALGGAGLAALLSRGSPETEVAPAEGEAPAPDTQAPDTSTQNVAAPDTRAPQTPASEAPAQSSVAPGTPSLSGYWKGGEFEELYLDTSGARPFGWLRPAWDPQTRIRFFATLETHAETGLPTITVDFEPSAYSAPPTDFHLEDDTQVTHMKVALNPDWVSAEATLELFVSRSQEEDPKEIWADPFEITWDRPLGEEQCLNFVDLKILEAHNVRTAKDTSGLAIEIIGDVGSYLSFEVPVRAKGRRTVDMTISSKRAYDIYIDNIQIPGYVGELPSFSLGEFNFSKETCIVTFGLGEKASLFLGDMMLR